MVILDFFHESAWISVSCLKFISVSLQFVIFLFVFLISACFYHVISRTPRVTPVDPVLIASKIMVAVDGGWGNWTPWSACYDLDYAVCGNGLTVRTRVCDNPLAQYGGGSCLGDSAEIQVCTESCKCKSYKTFRSDTNASNILSLDITLIQCIHFSSTRWKTVTAITFSASLQCFSYKYLERLMKKYISSSSELLEVSDIYTYHIFGSIFDAITKSLLMW